MLKESLMLFNVDKAVITNYGIFEIPYTYFDDNMQSIKKFPKSNSNSHMEIC